MFLRVAVLCLLPHVISARYVTVEWEGLQLTLTNKSELSHYGLQYQAADVGGGDTGWWADGTGVFLPHYGHQRGALSLGINLPDGRRQPGWGAFVTTYNVRVVMFDHSFGHIAHTPALTASRSTVRFTCDEMYCLLVG